MHSKPHIQKLMLLQSWLPRYIGVEAQGHMCRLTLDGTDYTPLVKGRATTLPLQSRRCGEDPKPRVLGDKARRGWNRIVPSNHPLNRKACEWKGSGREVEAVG